MSQRVISVVKTTISDPNPQRRFQNQDGGESTHICVENVAHIHSKRHYQNLNHFLKIRVNPPLLLLAILWLAVCSARATVDAALQMQLGNPSGATADTNNH